MKKDDFMEKLHPTIGIPCTTKDITEYEKDVREADPNGYAFIERNIFIGNAEEEERTIETAASNPRTRVIILGVDGKYNRVTKNHRGQVINLYPGGPYLKSAFDFDVPEDNDIDDPFTEKADFVTDVYKTLTKRYLRQYMPPETIYDLFYTAHQMYKDVEDKSTAKSLTIEDLYKALDSAGHNSLSENLRIHAETAASKPLPITRRTNIDAQNRVVCYNISGSPAEKIPIMLTMLGHVWNEIRKYKDQETVRTRCFIDYTPFTVEIDEELKVGVLHKWLNEMWTSARKHNTVITCMTDKEEIKKLCGKYIATSRNLTNRKNADCWRDSYIHSLITGANAIYSFEGELMSA